MWCSTALLLFCRCYFTVSLVACSSYFLSPVDILSSPCLKKKKKKRGKFSWIAGYYTFLMLTASCWCDGLDLFIAVRKMATKPAGEKCWWAITIYNQTIISFPFCCCERHLRSYTALKHQYDTYILKRFPATPNLFTAWSGVSVTSAQPYVQITQTLFDFLEMGKKKKK